MDRPSIEIGIAVVSHDGCYLIGLRAAGAPLAGLWEFPGGKVRPGESPADAAVRECREETGLSVVAETSCAVIEHDYEHGHLRLHFWRCSAAPDAALADAPPRFRWVRAAELPNYEFPPANAPIIDLLIARPERGASAP